MKGICIRSGRLIFGLALLSAVFFGCTQKDDIVTSIERSVLTLEPQNLPTPPAGMIYELWISKETVADTAFDLALATSLGRFSYISNDSLKSFLNADGSLRDAIFDLGGDFQSYRSVFVGLHRTTDVAGTRPGAIMLIAYIPGGLDIPIRMVFPQHDSLWDATCYFNLEGVSDNDRISNDAHGLWFSAYRWGALDMPDTTALTWDSTALDTIKPIICGNPPDTCNDSLLKKAYPYSLINIRPETTRVIFPNDSLLLGIDSFMHIGIRYDLINRADSTYPYIRRRLGFNYATAAKSVTIDVFSQDEFGLPVVSEWGWKYAGWALTHHVPPSAKVGALTPPAWTYRTPFKNWIPDDTGGMIPTGTFADINSPDDANPFVLNNYLPPFPGEDFLKSPALTDSLGVSEVNLMPTPGGNVGSILITMEPQNRLVTNTNFPLIAFLGTLPDRTDSVVNPASRRVVLNMMNTTSVLGGDQPFTFPIVAVKVQRY